MRHHPLPFDTGEDERILGPLTLAQTLWLGAGGFVAFQLLKMPLPLPGVLKYVHAVVPLIPTAAMGFIKINDIPLPKYISMRYACRKRKRTIRYKGVS